MAKKAYIYASVTILFKKMQKRFHLIMISCRTIWGGLLKNQFSFKRRSRGACAQMPRGGCVPASRTLSSYRRLRERERERLRDRLNKTEVIN
jgi:hypothetical protein